MSFLTSVFQAIAQAICWIFPISEAGHSALFHDFSNRFSGACSALTGIVHIGIALGIVLSMFGTFRGLFIECVSVASDLVKKQIKQKQLTNRRSFLYMILVSFLPMLLLAIPSKNFGTFYNYLRSSGFNHTLLDDGIYFAITGLLIFAITKIMALKKNNKAVSLVPALVVGFANVLLVSLSGLSLVAGEIAILLLFGVSNKDAYRYPFVISVPFLIVTGIVELCVAVTPANAVHIIFGIVLSILASFVAVRVFKYLFKSNKLKFFGIYDIAIGVIAFVIGCFELIIK